MRVDYIGFALLTLGVGALQIMLDKGQEDDWFGSRFITTLAVVAGVCLPALVIYEWFRRDPLIDVRLFTNRNFATANLMMLLVGANSFATTVLVPQFLQTLMGYTAQKAGMVLSVGALLDRKSTRLNSSHGYISYAVFCLKKKKKNLHHHR